jgi:DNA-binding LacI/PurR family transcriptional regulator
MKRTTIHDVARAAGVSTTTVSDALNGRGRLPLSTRERVATVAQQLGYSARASARRLREGRTGQIAIYCPFLGEIAGGLAGEAYYMELAFGVAEVALSHELALVLLPPTASPVQLRDLDVDGLIVADPVRDDPGVSAFVGRGIPVVSCGRDLTPGAAHAGCVETDDALALSGLLDHLANKGAERIALIAPNRDTAWGDSLATGYEQWCAAHQMLDRRVEVPITPRPEHVERAAHQLLQDRDRPDAIVSAINNGAIGILQVASRLDVSVPQRLMVASCVDGAMMLASVPPVTAIDLQPALMGRQAAELLAGLLNGSLTPGVRQVLPTELRVRASTNPQPA